MVHKLSLWAGSKHRSRRKKLITVWEEHSLPYLGGLITGSVPELLADIIFHVLFIEIGTWKQQVMIYSICYAERFSFTQRISVCTLPLVLSSEVSDWSDRPWTPARIALSKCFSVLFFFSYLYNSLFLMFPFHLTRVYFFFLVKANEFSVNAQESL